MAVVPIALLASIVYYWGEGGQYGPFEIQKDREWVGWPNFGQVLRYFRKKAKLSAKVLGMLYGKAVNKDGRPISEAWIIEMENDNKVPVDMEKRRVLARLLNIPPMLFGLAVLEDLQLEPCPQVSPVATGQTKLVRVAVDTTKYQDNIRKIWQLHETSNALSELSQLVADIRDLESFERQAQGDLRYHVQEMLLSNQILATHIVRDQRQFSQAYYHANEAVRVAKNMHDCDLKATALFTRGWTRLEWGQFSTIAQSVFQIQQDKIKAAIHDFEEALSLFPALGDKEYIHPQLLGTLTMFLSRAHAVLALSKGEAVPTSVFVSLDDIESTVGKQEIDDSYTRVLLKGERISWHKGNYHDHRATTFTLIGLPNKALKELSALENLMDNSYNRDETRRFVWLDILRANIFMEQEDFYNATMHAKRALLACQDIHSIQKAAIITDIYGRLLKSDYKASRDVQELGDILRESPVIFLEPGE